MPKKTAPSTTSRQPQNRPTLRPLLRLSDHNLATAPLITAEPVQPAFETNPAVRALCSNLRAKEPRDYVQAILLLVDLGRPELAKPIMADLAKLNLTNDQRIAIVTEFGPQGMLHIAHREGTATRSGLVRRSHHGRRQRRRQ